MSELDEQMEEVAKFFAGQIKGAHDVQMASALDRSRLDFSLDSLRAVDRWLGHLHEAEADVSDPQTAESVVWAGAYVGEVIRRNSERQFGWLPYEAYMATQEEKLRRMIPYTFGTQFILADANGGMTLPINKVWRWLDEGPENDLHFYASCDMKSK